MAPERTAVRLHDLTPETVSDEVVQILRDHVERVCRQLRPWCDVTYGERQGTPAIAVTLRDLCIYAQTGRLAGGLVEADVMDGIGDVVGALYECAMDSGTPTSLFQEASRESETLVEVVLLAAYARMTLRQGSAVNDHALAALGGVGRSRINQLVGARDLRRDANGKIRAADAVRWLAKRGVHVVDRRHSPSETE